MEGRASRTRILVRGVWREDFSSPAYSFPPASVLFDASGEKGTADSIKARNGRWNRGRRGRQGWLSRCTLKPGPRGLPEKVQPSGPRTYGYEAPKEGNGPASPAAWPFWDVTPLKTEGGGEKTPPQHSGSAQERTLEDERDYDHRALCVPGNINDTRYRAIIHTPWKMQGYPEFTSHLSGREHMVWETLVHPTE